MRELHITEDVQGMINHVEAYLLSYVNLEEMTVEYHPELTEESSVLLRLPYEEELTDYNSVMYEYIMDNDICIPRGAKAKRFLHEHDMLDGFWAYKNRLNVEAVERWFLAHEIRLITVQ